MTPDYTAAQIEALGGSRWTKIGMDRVYLDTAIWASLIGLDVDYYKSGNISSATLDGERLSNARAHEILTCVEKVYWDATDSQIHIRTRAYPNRYTSTVPTWIRDAIAAAITKTTIEEQS